MTTNLVEEYYKIHRMGSCFVGAAGTVANLQLMTNHPEWFDLRGKPLTKRFIVKNIIPKYYDLVKEMDKLDDGEENKGLPRCGCSFIITDGKKIFKVDDDFETMEMSRRAEVGCTDRIDLSMFLNAPEEYSPNDIILKALRTSAYRNDGVGAPYILINTRDNKFEVVEE